MMQASLTEAIGRLAVAEGSTQTAVPGLQVFRAVAPSDPFAVEYKPSLCIVGQGRKHALVGDETYEYDPNHYLVTSLHVPVNAQILEASPEHPFLAAVLDIDLAEVGQLLVAMPQGREPLPSTALRVSRMDARLTDAVTRLLSAAEDATEARILGPGMVREVLFHVLGGEQGDLLRLLALRDGHSHRVARAVQFMQDHFDEALDVATIAKSAGVSSSRLQHIFKDVTALSPIQYLKKVRLHRARVMMLSEGLNAGEAAYRVGYGSPSQFSREFKRHFGVSPSRAAREMHHAGAGG